MQTIMYRQGSVKYQLNLTRAENENDIKPISNRSNR